MNWQLIASLVTVLCLSNSCAQTANLNNTQTISTEANDTVTNEVTEAQAVRLAEQFIAQNGYTDLLPDKEGLTYESIEWTRDADKILQTRRDTLERRAYGIARNRKDDSPGWTVVFRYKPPAYPEMRDSGRAITMNIDGSDIRVEHVDFILSAVDKKL